MKHIGIVVPNFHVPSETFVVTEINALVKNGHKVSVLTFEHNNDCDNLDKSVSVIVIKKSLKTALLHGVKNMPAALRGLTVANKFASVSSLSLFGYGLTISKLIKQHNISHLHCHFMLASLAYAIVGSRLAGITVSSIGHGHDVYVNEDDLKEKLAQCDFSVAVCSDMVNKFKQRNAGQIKLLHCGVDLNLFSAKPTYLNDSIKLLFIGRLVEKKGLQFLLPALKYLVKKYDVILDIVGDGPMLNDLKYMAEQLNIKKNVRFLGRKRAQWIAQNTVNYSALVAPFCIANNGDRDTGPLVLKEAMASGIPVITTDLMGTKEIVNEDVGFKCEPESIAELEKTLVKFCELTPYERYLKGVNAKRRVASQFNALSQAKKLSGWIQTL
jgi:glycosyltransferase involved in cell wall biosynthesis